MRLAPFAALGAVAAYVPAYVEYAATSPCSGSPCGTAQKAASIRDIAGLARTAAAEGATLLVLPEYGVTGFYKGTKAEWVIHGYAEELPKARGVPCRDGDDRAVAGLSCIAREQGIALVANIMEWDSSEMRMYNCDIVLDRDGTLVGKYRKMNLWGEAPNVDAASCSPGDFTLADGTRIGVITCADLIYEHPLKDLLARGVRNFVMPAAWSNEMADMQVMAYAQGWSAATGASLVLSNHRRASESGSGIWQAGLPIATTYHPGSDKASVVVGAVPPRSEAGRAPRAPRLALRQHGVGWAFAPLAAGRVCSGGVCCRATATTTQGYVLAALNGDDVDGDMSVSAEVCAVLSCADAGRGCLDFGRQVPGGATEVKLVMEKLGAERLVPEVVASSPDEVEILLVPNSTSNGYLFAETVTGATLAATSAHNLTSVVLYGRRFDRDSLPYRCNDTMEALV
mmetsp:Transcript_13922/g.30025  ORF Transcript_13922/g.30025 Transcript_13922/m.30025 type:complete len:455 (-) Transcript_13922:156-1520(-)